MPIAYTLVKPEAGVAAIYRIKIGRVKEETLKELALCKNEANSIHQLFNFPSSNSPKTANLLITTSYTTRAPPSGGPATSSSSLERPGESLAPISM